MSLKKNVIANYLGQAWTTLMGLAFVPLYIRYLGMEAYGLIGVFSVVQTWLNLLDIGLTPTLSREMARFSAGAHSANSIRTLLRSIEVIAIVAASIIVIVVWLTSDWLASDWLRVENLPQAKVAQAFTIMGVLTGLRFIEGLYRSAVIGLQKQVFSNCITAFLATLRGMGALGILVFYSATIQSFFAWQLFVSLVSALIFGFYLHATIPAATAEIHFSLTEMHKVRNYAGGTFVITLLGFLMSQADKLILTRMITLKEFGYYSLAFMLASQVRLFAAPIDQATYPRMVELYQKDQWLDLSKLYHKTNQLNVALIGVVAVFGAIHGKSVLKVWLVDENVYKNVYPLLALLLIGMALNGFMNTSYYLQMAAGWTGLMLKINATMALGIVPLIYYLVKNYGAQGAALAWLIINILYMIIVAKQMHKKLLPGEMWKWYRDDLFKPIFPVVLLLYSTKSISNALLSSVYELPILFFLFLLSTLIALLCSSEWHTTIILKVKGLLIS